jgi:hypothetical protein
MPDRIIEEHVVHDGGGGSSSSGPLTALIIVLFLLIVLAFLYFSGALRHLFGPHKTEVDININKPGIVLRIN